MPSWIRVRSTGLVGDWPCFAEMMIAVLLARPLRADLGHHRAELGVHVVERADEQRAGDGPAGQVAAGQAVEVGSFSAVETVWKFIPKIAGTPTWCVPLWS